MKESCHNCRFAKRLDWANGMETIACHRHAPTPRKDGFGLFPQPPIDELWCGDWEEIVCEPIQNVPRLILRNQYGDWDAFVECWKKRHGAPPAPDDSVRPFWDWYCLGRKDQFDAEKKVAAE